MKPMNFPARKLARQLKAQGKAVDTPESKTLLEDARTVRTKKSRSGREKASA